MKDHFNRFVIRFLTAFLLGLALLWIHRWSGHAAAGIFAPRFASPWELGKLAYWPLLGSLALTGWMSGGIRDTLRRAMPCVVLTPAALFLVFWAVSLLRPAGGVYLLFWLVALLVGTALSDREWEGAPGNLWLILAVALGVLYLLFTFLPPLAGPFLDPADAAAMATIPD